MTLDPLRWLDDELAALEAAGLRRSLTCRAGSQRAAAIRLGKRQLVNFGSNDYLGLAAEGPWQAVVRAIEQVGWGSGASPLVTGRGTIHVALERALAQFEGTESALLFSSGYAANLGTIAALVGRGDAVYLDAKNHASIIDGCRLSGARLEVYPHGDVSFLQTRLQRRRDLRRRLIVTDALFSMDGDLAPLPDLAEIAERHDAMLMVDEAHATGVFGTSGRGVCEQLGVEHGVHVRVGTLSKALGSMGGFVAGSAPLIDWLANRARSYVFSTAPPEAMAAYALETLRTVASEPFRRTELLQKAARLRAALQRQGWNTGRSESQIVPVILGTAERTMRLAQALQDRGLFVPGIRPPSVPKDECLLRVSLSYRHSDGAVQLLLDALGEAAGRWPP
ncbi:MAG: 8-amino-7-oxononanoate synthase [Candidatus Anammoximicrobium sp.]|nr:8-amino-7-oxononanoate synthase [Candidatus Anammoximicrobium sp.]